MLKPTIDKKAISMLELHNYKDEKKSFKLCIAGM